MHIAEHIVWGPELSPFLLKIESLLAQAGVPFRRLPRDGTRLENLRAALAVERARRSRTALRPPANDELDEVPLVPFLLAPGYAPAGLRVLYDSSAIAAWLDRRFPRASGPFVPSESPESPDAALAFVTRLIDEAFDEFGLSMVHHNRWKLAARDNDDPGRRLAREYRRQLPPGVGRWFAAWFARRQVRRLPYLFSVAPEGYRVQGLAEALTPPSRAGFPPTHALLELAWERHLAAVESVLAVRPFLLGERFTLADASVYGQLSMNLTDTAAARRLRELAPRTFAWLESIRAARHVQAHGALVLDAAIDPLLAIIADTFVPLMQANDAAWREHSEHSSRSSKQTRQRFNEAGFDAGESLYDGEMLGHPFRSVVKTFQVRVWRDLRHAWAALPDDARQSVAARMPRHDVSSLFA